MKLGALKDTLLFESNRFFRCTRVVSIYREKVTNFHCCRSKLFLQIASYALCTVMCQTVAFIVTLLNEKTLEPYVQHFSKNYWLNMLITVKKKNRKTGRCTWLQLIKKSNKQKQKYIQNVANVLNYYSCQSELCT